ncbi:hypothetical protein RN001_001900 [Aquatica leii]|uniref:Uncharacterized protein n=1 Tax=Aquatica leii TaxID=1421715 RepID=A0AAN7SLJ5_9COLE|nr:hypothetical protein RN001_001900 [Aquatica leii]
MNMQPDEMEQLATFMGHTKKTHSEFYRLPQDIYQTAKVAKVLFLLEKGKGKEFRGKSLHEINLEKDIYYSSDSCDNADSCETQSFSEKDLNEDIAVESTVANNKEDSVNKKTEWLEKELTMETDEKELMKKELNEEIVEKNEIERSKKSLSKKLSGRIRWTAEEKKIVLEYFSLHLKNKKTPKKHKCDQFFLKHGNSLTNKDWVRVKTFVYNAFRDK